MAVESPLLHLGWCTLSTLDDARRASITGTTLNGPNGSGQFYWVYPSSVAAANFQVRLGSSLAGLTSTNAPLGILQNTPGPGEAADVGFIGVSKCIAGSTSIVMGTPLMASSAPVGQAGQLVAYASGATGAPIGYALEAPTSTGALFSAMIFASGMRST
jgi:hypothetical protein